MHANQIDLWTAVVTILAVVFYFWTGLRVGAMRGKHKIDAPAMTGNDEFERSVRVQMNTLEWMVVFLPLLWLSAIYFSPAMTIVYLSWLPVVLGFIWVLGRVLYMNGYMQAANKRSTGFLIAGIAVLGLLICAIVGVAMMFGATTA